MKFKNLNKTKQNRILAELKKEFPYFDFEIIKGRPVQKGIGGSDADFIEIPVEKLFDLMTGKVFN